VTVPDSLAVPPAHLALIRALLDAHLPPGASAFAFGSRATGRNRRFSDLDLLIDAGRPLTLGEWGDLNEAFTESDLPWKVDVIDRHAIQPEFLRVIEPNLIPVRP